MQYSQLLQQAKEQLIKAGFDSNTATQDCNDILLYCLKISQAEFITKKNNEVKQTDEVIFNNAIVERLKHKPIQYITHNAVFFGYNLFVNENCLIPRVDSEILIEQALKYIKQNIGNFKSKTIKILDACCGSGCLGLTFAKELEKLKLAYELVLLDKSTNAIQVSKINSQKLEIKSKLLVSDVLLNGLGFEKYDIIFCNPPYIETDIIKTLDKEVKDFEPHLALDGGRDGLTFYKTISKTLKNNLTTNGISFFEIGYNQGESVKNIFSTAGFNVEIVKDYGKQDRCAVVYLEAK